MATDVSQCVATPTPSSVQAGKGDVVVLFALEREAAPFRRAVRRRPGIRIAVTGVGQTSAKQAVATVLAGPPSRLIVMAGFCGALRPGMSVGQVVIPEVVVDASGRAWPTAEALLPLGVLQSVRMGRILTTNRLIAGPAEKQQLGTRHQADAVDMESAVVAAACALADTPFLAVRAVSDTVDTTLSPTLVRLLAGGAVSIRRVCAALVGKPSLLIEFLRLARDTRTAAQQLAEALIQVVDRAH